MKLFNFEYDAGWIIMMIIILSDVDRKTEKCEEIKISTFYYLLD